ncbi:MAG: acyl-CoA reductase [Weeksellaceae bacterium]|nr:acyl-CoA reductase [Weeksellaceae bacterium]
MKQTHIIQAFTQLGQYLQQQLENATSQPTSDLQVILQQAQQKNPWFTTENTHFALQQWAQLLQQDKLQDFVSKYNYATEPKKVGIIMAGNIPLVGWHDLLCVLLSGHIAYIKLSSSDNVIIPRLCEKLIQIEPQLEQRMQFVPQIKDYDAVIGTGSSNTERTLREYFSHVPLLLRGSRTSVAIITDDTTDAELQQLGDDVMRYFGLGCRNITQLFLPENFHLDRLFAAFYPWKDIATHFKYTNNYDYNRAIGLMNHENLYDNGFLLLRESQALFSPVGVLNYAYYKDTEQIHQFLAEHANSVQCVVGDQQDQIAFGSTQTPDLQQFADGIDTMQFLENL